MARKYRKRNGARYDTWHFCSNCRNWPKRDYAERSTRPTNDELCSQCVSKRDRKVCS